MIRYDILFTRNLENDVAVVSKDGAAPSVRTFAERITREIAPFLDEGMTLDVHASYRKLEDGREYTLTGAITAKDKIVGTDEKEAPARRSALAEMVSLLQAAYDGGASGRFRVTSLDFDDCTITADTILLRDADDALKSGRHLLDLSPLQVFDRIKMQTGSIALIAAGTFNKADSISKNDTSYAVGSLDEDGLFNPFRSHLRYGEAIVVFDKACQQRNAVGQANRA